MEKKRQHVLINVLLAFCSLVVVFLLLELCFRVLNIRPQYYKEKEVIFPRGAAFKESSIPNLGYESVPHSAITHCYDGDPRHYFDNDGCLTYIMNSHGLRDHEYSREKAPGVFRIVGLGDSFTFGTGVRLEDTYLKRLEQRLTTLNSSQKYEVINAGVGSYDTCQEVAFFKSKAIQYNPDLVMIGFFLNDATDMPSISLIFEKAETESRQSSRLPLLHQLRKHLWCIDFILYRIERTIKTTRYIEEYRESYLGTEEKLQRWEKTQACLANIKHITEQQHIQLLLVIFPILVQLDDHYPFQDIHMLIKQVCDNYGIPVLDLFDSYKGYQDSSLWVHPMDQHPNEIGHNIAANAIFEFLIKQHFIHSS